MRALRRLTCRSRRRDAAQRVGERVCLATALPCPVACAHAGSPRCLIDRLIRIPRGASSAVRGAGLRVRGRGQRHTGRTYRPAGRAQEWVRHSKRMSRVVMPGPRTARVLCAVFSSEYRTSARVSTPRSLSSRALERAPLIAELTSLSQAQRQASARRRFQWRHRRSRHSDGRLRCASAAPL